VLTRLSGFRDWGGGPIVTSLVEQFDRSASRFFKIRSVVGFWFAM
jgi:hypothetical protein